MMYLVTIGAVLLGTGLWLWLLRLYDRVEPEALRYLIPVALIGGAASVAGAAVLNEAVRLLLGIQVDVISDPGAVEAVQLMLLSLCVGLIEESSKAVAAVYATRILGDLDEPIDAMIYAMTVALGFAALENVLYAIRFGNEVLLVRFLWPVPAHMAYAAIWGYGLARARFVIPTQNTARVMLPYVLGAGLIHAGTNYLLFQQGTLTALLSLAALAVLGYLAHQRLIRLEAESPFLRPGECPSCRYLNPPHAVICEVCGEALQDTEMFRTCPCGLTRVPARLPDCPVCGVQMVRPRHAGVS